MAIREINSVVQTNYNVASRLTIHAGMILARQQSTGNAVLADRTSTIDFFVGLAADDSANTGNTMIEIDPVGATAVAAENAFTANNNGMFSAVKRALGDYQDETVSNVTDLNSGAEGPRRGIGVYTTPSAQYVIDGACYVTASTQVDSAISDDGISPWTIGDLLTCGITANAGKFVKCDINHLGYGRPVAIIDKIDASGTLIYITLLPAPTTWTAA